MTLPKKMGIILALIYTIIAIMIFSLLSFYPNGGGEGAPHLTVPLALPGIIIVYPIYKILFYSSDDIGIVGGIITFAINIGFYYLIGISIGKLFKRDSQ